MNINIPLPKIQVEENYILELVVTSPYSVTANLMTPQDPTKIDTHPIVIDSTEFFRDGDRESMSRFVARVMVENKIWSNASIQEHKTTQELVGEFFKVFSETYNSRG